MEKVVAQNIIKVNSAIILLVGIILIMLEFWVALT